MHSLNHDILHVFFKGAILWGADAVGKIFFGITWGAKQIDLQ